MNALILAAGYATRMYPVTLETPKALLPVGGRPLIAYLLDSIDQARRVDEVFLVTNHKFVTQFRRWAESANRSDLHIIDDGTVANEHRMGAVADIRLAIETSAMESDLLVMGADNIFCLSFPRFIEFFGRKGTDCITVYAEKDGSKLTRTGIAEVDPDWRVISFEEKPARPRSNLASPPLYCFRQTTRPLFGEYLAETNNPDAPGYFVQWLVRRRTVHAFLFQEPRYNIGDLESYRTTCELFAAG